jgi:hypothetical protein
MTKQKVTWGPKYYMIYTVLNGFEYHATVDYIRHYEYRMMITKTWLLHSLYKMIDIYISEHKNL